MKNIVPPVAPRNPVQWDSTWDATAATQSYGAIRNRHERAHGRKTEAAERLGSPARQL